MDKMIQIPEFQLKKIEDTLRMAHNLHKSNEHGILKNILLMFLNF